MEGAQGQYNNNGQKQFAEEVRILSPWEITHEHKKWEVHEHIGNVLPFEWDLLFSWGDQAQN